MKSILISLVIFAVLAFAAFSLLICWSCIVVGARYDEESERYAQARRQAEKSNDPAAGRREERQNGE